MLSQDGGLPTFNAENTDTLSKRANFVTVEEISIARRHKTYIASHTQAYVQHQQLSLTCLKSSKLNLEVQPMG